MLEAIHDIIEMSCKSRLDLASRLAHILDTTYFACDTINEIGTAARDVFHCCEILFGVVAGNCATFV